MSNSFSQPIRPTDDTNQKQKSKKIEKKSKSQKSSFMTYHEFFNKKVELKKFKVDELKAIARQNLLKVGGRKPALIDRIETFFLLSKNVSKIQSTIRMYLAKRFVNRGPAMKNRKICVNDSDFVSLEPIEDIHWMDFYSFTDNKGFCYGFDINNLVEYLKKSKARNPYTKEEINVETWKRIKQLHRIYNFYKKNVLSLDNNSKNSSDIQRTENIILTNETLIKNRLSLLKNKNTNERIVELFIEIDLLGNYTQSRWFSDLSKDQLVSLSLRVHYMWNGGHIPYELKRKICPYFNPTIYNVSYIPTRIERDSVSLEYMRTYCITLFENIVYGSFDIESRKLGVLYLLSLLTDVSVGARQSLPWLTDIINI